MKNMDGILARFDMAGEINKSFVNNTAVMGIVNAHNEIQRKLRPYQSIFDTISKVNKMMDVYRPEMAAVMGITKLIEKNAFMIPNNTMTVMDLISKQHRSLFASTKAITDAMSSVTRITQLNNLQVAINGISRNLTRIAALTNNWEIIKDFEEVSGQALEISESLTEDLQLSEETSKAFDKLVEMVVSFLKKNRQAGIYYLLFIDMVLRVASFHQYYDFLKTKPEIATKEDVKKLETKLLKSIEEKLKEEKEYRITNVECKVYLKPRKKSMVLSKLPKNSDVIILQVKHKWVYVSFDDPGDNFSQTGWILKKYLS